MNDLLLSSFIWK